MKIVIFLTSLIFLIGFTSAAGGFGSTPDFGYNNEAGPILMPGINYSKLPTVNSSDWWVTNTLGPLDDANSAQFDNIGGTLTIDESHIELIGNAWWLRLDQSNWFDGSNGWNIWDGDSLNFNEIKLDPFILGLGYNHTEDLTIFYDLRYLTSQLNLYFYNSSSTINSSYTEMNTTIPTGDAQLDHYHNLVDGDNLLTKRIFTEFNLTLLQAGAYNQHTTIDFHSGNRDLSMRSELYILRTNGTEQLIGTSPPSIGLINGAYQQVIWSGIISNDVIFDEGDYLTMYLYATVSGGGSLPDIDLIVAGDTAARLDIGINPIDIRIEEIDPLSLHLDGSTPMQGNTNQNNNNISFVDWVSGNVGNFSFLTSPTGVINASGNNLSIDTIFTDHIEENTLMNNVAIDDSISITGSPVTDITGTIDTDGSVNIVGIGTKFLTEVKVGDALLIGGLARRTVIAIADDTHLTIRQATVDYGETAVPKYPAIAILKDRNGLTQMYMNWQGKISMGADLPATNADKLTIAGTLKFFAVGDGLKFSAGDRFYEDAFGSIAQEYQSAFSAYTDSNDNNEQTFNVFSVYEGDISPQSGGSPNLMFSIKKNKEAEFFGNVTIGGDLKVDHITEVTPNHATVFDNRIQVNGVVAIGTTPNNGIDLYVKNVNPIVTFEATSNGRTMTFNPGAGAIDSSSSLHFQRFLNPGMVVGQSSEARFGVGNAVGDVQDSDARFLVASAITTEIGAIIRAPESMTADLMQFQDFNENVLLSISAIGNLTTIGNITADRGNFDSINVTGNINNPVNITLSNGGKLWGNSTCTFLSSPDGSTVQEICNA